MCVRVFLYWLIHSLIKFSLLGFGPNRVSACVVLCYPQFLHCVELHTWAYVGDNCCSCTLWLFRLTSASFKTDINKVKLLCLSLWIFFLYCLVICPWACCTEFSSIFSNYFCQSVVAAAVYVTVVIGFGVKWDRNSFSVQCHACNPIVHLRGALQNCVFGCFQPTRPFHRSVDSAAECCQTISLIQSRLHISSFAVLCP